MHDKNNGHRERKSSPYIWFETLFESRQRLGRTPLTFSSSVIEFQIPIHSYGWDLRFGVPLFLSPASLGRGSENVTSRLSADALSPSAARRPSIDPCISRPAHSEWSEHVSKKNSRCLFHSFSLKEAPTFDRAPSCRSQRNPRSFPI